MKQKSLLVSVLTIAMALVLALTCILYCAAPGKQVSAEGEAAAPAATAPTATASYDFTSVNFDQSDWTAWRATGGTLPTVSAGTGLSITGGYQQLDNSADATSSYGTANPLKNQLTDGFSVILNAAVTGFIDDYCNLFGFTKVSDSTPAQSGNNFFLVNSSGNGMHLNNIGTSGNDDDFYDITPGDPMNMSSVSQYILTVSDTAITIYLNGQQVTQYMYNASGAAGEYRCDTIDFVNNSDWFLLGRVCTFWGNGATTVQGVSLYDTALTADEIAAINESFADFTQLNALLDELSSFSVSNYDTSASGWEAAYAAFTSARAAAEALSILTATQEEVDNAVTALRSAYMALDKFLREADITDGLVSAFPLNSTTGGTNIVTNSTATEDLVAYMDGGNAAGAMTTVTPLTAETTDRYTTYQGVSAAKLYDEQHMSTYNNPNPYADRAATSKTMGLDIPTSAFAGVSSSTGLTITVNAYIENFYSGAWGRIFQLGDYQFSDTDGGQIFVAVNGNAASDIAGNGVISNSTNVCSILARQWYSISIVLDPSANTITIYTSGYQLNDSGAIEYMFGWYTAQTTNSNVTTLIGSIISDDAENWLGRSFWDTADTSVVGAVSNLSVYNRPLTATEVEMLHGTSDLSTLIANA